MKGGDGNGAGAQEEDESRNGDGPGSRAGGERWELEDKGLLLDTSCLTKGFWSLNARLPLI